MEYVPGGFSCIIYPVVKLQAIDLCYMQHSSDALVHLALWNIS